MPRPDLSAGRETLRVHGAGANTDLGEVPNELSEAVVLIQDFGDLHVGE